MSTIAIHSSSHAAPSSGYLANVGLALRALAAALLAVGPSAAPVKAAPVMSAAAERKRANEIATLYRMARGYDSVMPNLASELRAIAARG